MKSNFKDVLIVIFALIGLYLLFEISQKDNGRYVVINDGYSLVDSQTGKIYHRYNKEKVNPGEPVYYWVLKYDEVK